MLNPTDWTAKWISGDYKPKKKRHYPVDCFKKAFRADKPIAAARLYATARGVYDATLNGQRVEGFILAPDMTDYCKRIQYQTYDVTALLAGVNTVELRLADGWFRGSVAAYGVTNVFGAQTSVLAQLEITYTDGTRQVVATDEGWLWSNDGPSALPTSRTARCTTLQCGPPIVERQSSSPRQRGPSSPPPTTSPSRSTSACPRG